MISCNGVNKNGFVHGVVKVARFSPSKVVHLVNERALTDHSTNKVNRKWSVICVSTENAMGPR